MPEIAWREALNQALSEEMERDVNVFLMGEEVARYNGAYKVSQGLLDKFGSARVVEATHPLFEDATLRIIERMRFRPAKVLDQAVAVVVQIPIEWRPAN